MLSFFRKKSLEDSNQSADQTVPSVSSTCRNSTICDNLQIKDTDALVRELGYSNLTELKETIYGNWILISSESLPLYCDHHFNSK